MSSFISWLNESVYKEPLSPACRQCADGSKMVVLVTGLCSTSCWYCPLSHKKSQKDVIYADEWKLEHQDDTDILIEESQLINATGSGITGGDPLTVPERTLRYITLLKETFGPEYHIHLYTSGLTHTEFIPKFVEAGLDEIRFHPMENTWGYMGETPLSKTIRDTVNISVNVAIEIPAIPHKEQEIIALIDWAGKTGVNWVNLNELEFSEQNESALHQRGFIPKNELSAAVQGSEETALAVLDYYKEKEVNIGLHYCSVSFKDGIQLKQRLLRRAHNVAQPHQYITEEGTLLIGIIETTSPLDELYGLLKQDYELPDDLCVLKNDTMRIEIAPWILEEIAAEIADEDILCSIIEIYPTADQLEVERIPLPSNETIFMEDTT